MGMWHGLVFPAWAVGQLRRGPRHKKVPPWVVPACEAQLGPEVSQGNETKQTEESERNVRLPSLYVMSFHLKAIQRASSGTQACARPCTGAIGTEPRRLPWPIPPCGLQIPEGLWAHRGGKGWHAVEGTAKHPGRRASARFPDVKCSQSQERRPKGNLPGSAGSTREAGGAEVTKVSECHLRSGRYPGGHRELHSALSPGANSGAH